MSRFFRCAFVAIASMLALSFPLRAGAPLLKILFLGDNGHHRPNDRFRQLQPVLEKRGIELSYTDAASTLNPKTLARYDGVLIYANLTKIAPEQEAALLAFVASGKGFIPIHCASYCFLNSEKYIELVGAQFQRHGTGTFRTTIAEPNHPIMKGYGGFESWDETYVHTKHNTKDRTVLEYRKEKGKKEPWTWVRTHGKGRVFYTAWGHDERTWANAGFQTLVERGIRWAVGAELPALAQADASPQMTPKRTDVKPFEYKDAKIPFYRPPASAGIATNPSTKMQLPLDPAESMKHFVHPVDFELKLFVAEPQIKRPICMNWDERGRLWIAESVDYPNNLQRGGPGHDRIVICEDTDGDGVADKFTVFADKLSIPTSFVFANGGVVVMQAPHTLFLRSTKGDDVADERKILFTGWGTRDTHAGPSNLLRGFDNWIYGMVGYSGFRGTVGGEQHAFNQGFYRFKPDGSKLEFLRSTSNNSWGVGFSEEGLLFGSTANGNPSVYMPIPNRYYEKVRGFSSSVLGTIAESNKFHPLTAKVRQVDFHGGFTAAAGHALYTARAYPQEYWNRAAFVTEPTGHLIATFLINKSGSNFSSRNAWNLLASDDEWAAPIMAEVGPDGNVWIIDWYNFIVQHNPTPPGFKTGKGAAYESDLRDKTHGRIYRLVAKKAVRAETLTLKDATPEKLAATLKNDNMFWRKHAQRLLVERGKTDVAPELVKLVRDRSVDAIGLNAGAIQAIWTLHGLNLLKDETLQSEPAQALVSALDHPSAGVRRNAVLALPGSPAATQQILAHRLLEDKDAQVRLAAFLKISEEPSAAEVGKSLIAALGKEENLGDRWMPDAITIAAAGHSREFLQGAVREKGISSTRALEILAIVAEHHTRSGQPVDSALLTSFQDANAKTAEVILGGLARGWRRSASGKVDADMEKALVQLMPKVTAAARGQLVQLAKAMGSNVFEKQIGEITKTMLAVVADEKQNDEARIAAAKQLIEFQIEDPKVFQQMLEVVSPRSSPQLSTGVLEALGGSTSPSVGPLLMKQLPTFTPQARSTALRTLLSRPETTRQFLSAVEKGELTLTELPLDQKQALASHPDAKIARRAKAILAKGGGLPNVDRQKVVAELLPLVMKTGDPVVGKAVFKKNCALCHTHSGEGAKIGPDLTGAAAHTKEHLLIDILDPSRSVEGNFRVYTVTTQTGLVLNGLLASETKTTVELFDAQAKKIVVQRDNIDTLVASPKSLMPDGFEKQLKQTELIDLLEFLTQRGKFVPLALDKAATIVSTQGMFYAKNSKIERLVLPDWSPRTVKGVPFHFVDPQEDKKPNVILLYSPNGPIAPKMPKSVKLDCNMPARAIHLLSGVSGWGAQSEKQGAAVMTVRLHYADGKTEDHPLYDGVHFADYIRKIDVPKSAFAFPMRGQQMRYLSVVPERDTLLSGIEFVKGPHVSAPIVLAVTVETK